MKGLSEIPINDWIETKWKFSHLDLSENKIGYSYEDEKHRHTITWFLLEDKSNIFFDIEDFEIVYENFMNSKGYFYDKIKL